MTDTQSPSARQSTRATNTARHYGSVEKTLHWLTALLILTAIPLGLVANGLPYDTDAELALKAQLFSAHKTVGVAAFAIGVLRILWAVAQPRPAPLDTSDRLRHFAAVTAHWVLYVSLVVVPLSGWIHHAATTGFAPILWPFGQGLPFVPASEAVAGAFAGIHWLATKLLAAAILAHAAGAVWHHVIRRDATLRRMLPGTPELPSNLSPHRTAAAPILAALGIWATTLGTGAALGLANDHSATPASVDLAEVRSDWVVEEGSIAITVTQLGQEVTGGFSDFTAGITFDEAPDTEGRHGAVEVVIAIPSLTLGSVTAQALGPDFFDAESHPTATFAGPIRADGTGYVVDGTLALSGEEVPVRLPFTLQIAEDGTARAEGRATLDRRDFGIGMSQGEANLGFAVEAEIAITARRATAD